MDFQSPKFWEFALLNNHNQISKNEGKQNLKLSRPAWFLQKLALKHEMKYIHITPKLSFILSHSTTDFN